QICDTDTRTIITAINNCNRNSVKGLLFVPFSPDVENAALSLAQAGIPVIAMDSPMQNAELQGVCRAEVHTNWVHDVDTMFRIMTDYCDVENTLIVGQNTTPASKIRYQGMQAKAGLDFHGIAINLSEGDPADTICSYLRANNYINGVMILNASTLTPNVFDNIAERYTLFVFDENELVRQNIGIFRARLSQQPVMLGEKAMEAFFTEPESKVVYIPSLVYKSTRPE
ncbi:MAG: hypothetical protein KBT04_06450, partial [Bacteroidales bacterium]|nr:hypothetical protein [Candidatus Colimorpha onthohippi]